MIYQRAPAYLDCTSSFYNLRICLSGVIPPLNISAITLPLITVSWTMPWTCFGSTLPYQMPCPASGCIPPPCRFMDGGR